MPPLNATDLQMYPCAGNPPIDAFLTNDILSTPAVVVIDAIAGANTNRGLGLTTALADPFELEQRWGGGRVTEQGPVGNSPPVPRRAAGAIGVAIQNIVSGWTLRVPFELARTNQIAPNQSLLYQLPLNGVGVPLNATLTFWDEGGTCSPFSQIQVNGNGVNVGGVPIFALTNPSQQITIQWDGANWQVIANSNPGGAPSLIGQRTTFVFRPGGVALENVYTNWALMMADVNAVAGPRWIEIDGSLATATVPIGTWNVDDCIFFSRGGLSSATNTLHFADGAHFTFTCLYLDHAVRFDTSALSPVVTVPPDGVFRRLTLSNASAIVSSVVGAAPFLQQSGTNITIVVNTLSFIGSFNAAIGPAITIDAGKSVFMDVVAYARLFNNSVTGAGTLQLSYTDDVILGLTQAGLGALVQTLLSLASQLSFTPGVAGNWNPVPTLASQALDQLAAPNVLAEIAPGPIGAAATITFTMAGTITRKRSGKVKVTAQVSVSPSAGLVATMQMFRDTIATPLPPLAVSGVTPVPAADGSMSLVWVDTLPDLAAHGYGVQVSAVGGNVAVAAGANASMTVEEL